MPEPTYDTYKNAENILISDISTETKQNNIVCEISPVSAVDMFYTDGCAANYDAKIILSVSNPARTYVSYFSLKNPNAAYGIVPDNIISVIKDWRHKVYMSFESPLTKN